MENDIKTIVVKLDGLEKKIDENAQALHALEKKVDAGFQSMDRQFKDVGENLAGIVDMISQRFGDREETLFLTERYGRRLDRLEDDIRVLKTQAGIRFPLPSVLPPPKGEAIPLT